MRDQIVLDLRSAGGAMWAIEPLQGLIAWRATSDDGKRDKAALKTLLHRIADQLPRQLGERNML